MRAKRTDSNLTEMVDCCRRMGLRVHVTNSDWDMTVQYGGITMLCEVRPANKPRKARKGNQASVHEALMIFWLQTPADCERLRETLIKWSTAIGGA